MKNRVIEAISRYDMLRAGDSVTVALSGGADSCALLYALYELRGELGITLSACHINHGLRGGESDSDERFARRLCEKLGIPAEVFRVDVRAAQRKHESIEEAARRLRYGCFEQVCAKYGSKLATAHTANDNAETVLMYMLRGTGTRGLAGIPAVRDDIIRPLIFCTREQTEAFCRERGIEYVTDSTNLEDNCTRNRIRHNVLPLLREFNPSFLDAVSRMTSAVAADESFLTGYAEKCAEECAHPDGGYYSRKLKELPEAVLIRVISSELRAHGAEPSALRIKQCRVLIEKGAGRVNLCLDRFAYVRKKRFFIAEERQDYRGRGAQHKV